MARAFGEAVVQDIHGEFKSGIQVDLIDPATNVRILDTVFADNTSAATLSLPLTTNQYGRAPFCLAAGKLVISRATINGVAYDDFISVADPTAAGGGGGVAGPIPAHTHVETDVTSLPTDLGGKAPVAHAHAETDVTNLSVDLAGKAAVAHAHVEGDVTNLGPDLAATEKTANKGIANGYVGLDNTTLVLASRLGTGTASSATYLRGDRSWAAVAGGANSTFEFQPYFPAPASGDTAKMRSSVTTTITVGGAIRTGGTGATVDIQKNGVSILTAPISLTATTWTTGTLVASPNLAAGDILSVVLSGVSGSPTDVLVAVYGTRATV